MGNIRYINDWLNKLDGDLSKLSLENKKQICYGYENSVNKPDIFQPVGEILILEKNVSLYVYKVLYNPAFQGTSRPVVIPIVPDVNVPADSAFTFTLKFIQLCKQALDFEFSPTRYNGRPFSSLDNISFEVNGGLNSEHYFTFLKDNEDHWVVSYQGTTKPDFEEFKFTINSGSDATFIIPTNFQQGTESQAYSYEWILNWGDGSEELVSGTGDTTGVGISHTYASANEDYQITIKPQILRNGWLKAFRFGYINSFNTGSGAPANRLKMRTLDTPLTSKMVSDNGYLGGDNDICSFMFHSCQQLTMGPYFNLPSSLKAVGNLAFQHMFSYCSALTMNDIFTFPYDIESAGTYFCAATFHSTTSLTMNDRCNLPSALRTTGLGFAREMFRNSGLAVIGDNFTMPQLLTDASETDFGAMMFALCPNLSVMGKRFNMPQRLTIAGNNWCKEMFHSDNLLTMNDVFTLPQALTSVGDSFCYNLFVYCNANNIGANFKLPQNLTSAGSGFMTYAFSQNALSTGGAIQMFGDLVLDASYVNLSQTYMYMFQNSGLSEAVSAIPQIAALTPSARKYTFQGTSVSDLDALPTNWK